MPTGRDAIINGINAGFACDPNLQSVTVQQVDADEGTVLDSVDGVQAVARHRRRDEIANGMGGMTRIERVRWRLRADQVPFTPDKRDRVVDSDGVTWAIDSVDTTWAAVTAIRHVAECTRVIG